MKTTSFLSMTKDLTPASDKSLPKWRQYQNLEHKDIDSLEETALLSAFIQEVIKVVTGVVAVLLSLKGLFVFYGAKQSNWLDESITFLTSPLITPFNGALGNPQSLEMPVFLSVISVLFLGAVLYGLTAVWVRLALWTKIHRKNALSVELYNDAAKKKLQALAPKNPSASTNYKLILKN